MKNLKIRINGKKHTFAQAPTLAEILSQLELKTGFFAVEVNREIVPKKEYPHFYLKDGDSVEIVHPVGGG